MRRTQLYLDDDLWNTLHARARSTIGLAVFGALTGASALAALFLGVLLAG